MQQCASWRTLIPYRAMLDVPAELLRYLSRLLAALDVHPRVAMAILRHSRIALTMEIYTQVPDKATCDALRRLSAELDEQPASEELAADLDGQGGAADDGAAG